MLLIVLVDLHLLTLVTLWYGGGLCVVVFSSQHANHIEVFVDVHRFSYLARFALHSYALPVLPKVDCDFALVVESREEEEMPEQILGSVRFTGMNFSKAPYLPVAPE